MRTLGLVLACICLTQSKAEAQLLRIRSVRGEIFSYLASPCQSPVEVHRTVSSPPTSPFSDQVHPDFEGCDSRVSARGSAGYALGFTADSLAMRTDSSSQSIGVLTAQRSDLELVLHVDTGHPLRYRLDLSQVLDNRWIRPDSVVSWSHGSFSLTDCASGAAIYNLEQCACPGPPREVPTWWVKEGILGPGDYRLQLHSDATSSDNYQRASGWNSLHLKVWEASTALDPTSWGLVKLRYR
jgi:hypothetical protein